MEPGRKLQWVQANRKRTDRLRTVATLAQDLAERIDDDEELVRIAGMIADVVDADFRAHCRVARVSRGMVLIHVDEASLVAAVQMRWSGPLIRALGRMSRGIAFAYGKAGVAIPLIDADAAGRT